MAGRTLCELPIEIVRAILEFVEAYDSKKHLYKCRLVNRFLESEVNRLCWHHEYSQSDPRIRPNEDRVFVHRDYSPLKTQFADYILEFLMGSKCHDIIVTQKLRTSMAFLMHAEQLLFPDFRLANFKSKDQLSMRDGFIDAYIEPVARSRFTEIAKHLTATFMFLHGGSVIRDIIDGRENRTLQDWCWFFKRWAFDLQYPALTEETPRNNIEMALATAAYLKNPLALAEIGPLSNFEEQVPHEPDAVLYHNALYAAVKQENYELVVPLIKSCKSLLYGNHTWSGEISYIGSAVRAGSLRMFELLTRISWEGPRLIPSSFGLLCHAARCSCSQQNAPKTCAERLAIVRSISENATSRRQKCLIALSATRSACAWGCLTIFRALVEQLNLNSAEFSNLHLATAARHGHLEIMEYLLTQFDGHFSLFFPVYNVGFGKKGANRDMMAYLHTTDDRLYTYGPLEPAKIRWLRSAAKQGGYAKVEEYLERRGGSA